MLTESDVYSIEKMARDKRLLNELGMGPLGDNLFKVIRSLGIQLVQVPFLEEGDNNADPFSALYLSSREHGHTICYIGVNTTDYWDKQMFALAHELYHHYESSEPFVLCRGLEHVSEMHELKANRFAAEFLLPTEKLINEIKDKNDGDLKLTKWGKSRLLRLIAEIHCDYRLPYKAIVRRLHEVGAVHADYLHILLQVDARDPNGLYWTIANNVNHHTFTQLNRRTQSFGVEGENLGKLLDNFESGFISLQELSEDLSLFGKSLEDYKLMEDIIDDEESFSFLYKEDEGES